MQAIKKEAQRLELKIEIIRPQDDFWQHPHSYWQDSDEEVWFLTSYATLGAKLFSAIFSLLTQPRYKFRLFCIEPDLRIISFLAKYNQPVAANNNVSLSDLAVLQEEAALSNDEADFLPPSDLFNVQLSEANISYIGFEQNIVSDDWSENNFLNTIFAEHRKQFIKIVSHYCQNNLAYALQPSLHFVCFSKFLETLLNNHWSMRAHEDFYFSVTQSMVQPVLVNKFKQYLQTEYSSHSHEANFEKLLQLEEYYLGVVIDKENLESTKTTINDFPATIDLLTIKAINAKNAFQRQQNLKNIADQEKQRQEDLQNHLQDLQQLLAKAVNVDSFNDDDSQKLLVLAYDKDVAEHFFTNRRKQVLMLDVSRIRKVDDLIQLNLAKYIKFSKNSTILANKKDSNRLAHWLLNAHKQLPKVDFPASRYQQCWHDFEVLLKELCNAWESILGKVIDKFFAQEIPSINNKLLVSFRESRSNFFKNIDPTTVLLFYKTGRIKNLITAEFKKLLPQQEVVGKQLISHNWPNLGEQSLPILISKAGLLIVEISAFDQDTNFFKHLTIPVIFVLNDTVDRQLIYHCWGANSQLIYLGNNQQKDNCLSFLKLK